MCLEWKVIGSFFNLNFAFKTCLYASGQMKLEWTNSEQTCLPNFNFLISYFLFTVQILFPLDHCGLRQPMPAKTAQIAISKSHWSAPTHFIKGVAGDIAHSVALKQMKIKKDILGGNETFTTFGLLSFLLRLFNIHSLSNAWVRIAVKQFWSCCWN